MQRTEPCVTLWNWLSDVPRVNISPKSQGKVYIYDNQNSLWPLTGMGLIQPFGREGPIWKGIGETEPLLGPSERRKRQ